MRDDSDVGYSSSPPSSVSGGGRSRAATTGRRNTRERSITSSGEYGVDYWRRLLAAPSGNERGYVRELAEQLAVHESALLRTVKPSELQGLAFAKATKQERAPNVLMLIAHFNRISRWVCTQVVKQPTVRERARCVRLFIDLARSSHELGNLNAVMEIVAALNSAALHRLKRTWEGLPKASKRDFDELCALVKPERAHASLRAEMKSAARRGAAVPYLGLYLTDLTFIEDGNPAYVDSDDGTGEQLVNLGKCAMLGKVLSEILTFQSRPYTTEPNESLALYFTSLDPPEDNEIYELSLICEPRESSGGGGDGATTPRHSSRRSEYGSGSSNASDSSSPLPGFARGHSSSLGSSLASPRNGLELLRKGVRLTQAAGMLARGKSRKASSSAAAADWSGWDK